tara:strand:+ start:2430 stop:3842 length:1413 start_codon:yes stop_codon:yes gene_type:complete
MSTAEVSVQKEVVKERIDLYEEEKKKDLIALGMSDKPWREILTFLANEIEMSTKMASFNHRILCFRDDGVYQLNKAIEKIYGVSTAKADQKPSGGGDKPIQTLDVVLADGRRVKVPYGEISLPDLGPEAGIVIGYNDDTNNLYIQGSCQFRFSSLIDKIIEQTKTFLNTESIYKDQAFEVGPKCVPQVMDLSNIEKEFMVISDKTTYDLRPLMTRILKPEQCIAKGVPLKTGILLEGPYGTGKTLLAFKVAHQAINNNWSFIYLKEPALLAQTLRLSRTIDNNGNGVIVFLEDVDQVTRGNRNAAMQDILNTLDGGDTKNMNVIAMFTTNHIELIEPTFLRGKRIGSVVSMGALDAETARKFVDHTFADYTLEPEGLDKVCERIAEHGIVPAFMAEITETVKSNMIFEESDVIKSAYIDASLSSYLRQVGLASKKDMTETNELKLSNSLGTLIAEKIEESPTIQRINDSV